MSRLLHAAARGARIQGYICGKWLLTAGICPDVDRIHPEDEHLQYGPISSALQKYAVTGDIAEADIPYIHGYFDMPHEDLLALSADDNHRFLFLLILAEALADLGL